MELLQLPPFLLQKSKTNNGSCLLNKLVKDIVNSTIFRKIFENQITEM